MGYMAYSPSFVKTRPSFQTAHAFAKGLNPMRLDYIITAIRSVWRFGSLDPTPRKDSRCTFPKVGLRSGLP